MNKRCRQKAGPAHQCCVRVFAQQSCCVGFGTQNKDKKISHNGFFCQSTERKKRLKKDCSEYKRFKDKMIRDACGTQQTFIQFVNIKKTSRSVFL